MNRFVAICVLPMFLLSCASGSNPFEPDPAATDPSDPSTPGTSDPAAAAVEVPEELANDLKKFKFDPARGTLTVTGLTLDDKPFKAKYRRRKGLDVPGYQAYTAQDDALDRHITAYVAQTRNAKAVRAGVTVSGGPRNRFFGGGYYERDGEYTPPKVTKNSGLVTYAGRYVGLTNVGTAGSDLRPVPAGTPRELVPTQSSEVRGKIVLQADFADNVVEGNIYDRRLTDAGNLRLPSVVLVVTGIEENGTFNGSSVEYDQRDFPGTNVIGTDIGDFGGVFGGPNASGVGGVVHLEQFDGPNDDLGFEGEEEFGAFVLDQCGQKVDAKICDSVNP